MAITFNFRRTSDEEVCILREGSTSELREYVGKLLQRGGTRVEKRQGLRYIKFKDNEVLAEKWNSKLIGTEWVEEV